MELLSGIALWLRGKRKADEHAANTAASRVRNAQDIMDETVNRLHAELDAMRADRAKDRAEHEQEMDQLRGEFLEVSETLYDCERDRVRLRIRLGELEGFDHD